jgi:hypothetical protein
MYQAQCRALSAFANEREFGHHFFANGVLRQLVRAVVFRERHSAQFFPQCWPQSAILSFDRAGRVRLLQ